VDLWKEHKFRVFVGIAYVHNIMTTKVYQQCLCFYNIFL